MMINSFLFYQTIFIASIYYFLRFSKAANNDTDRLALLEIKSKITSDPLGVLNSWNDTLHFCKWYGITCGRRHQRVTGLNLQSLRLTGTISPYIGNISFLKTFQLQNNNFTGSIPTELGHLHRMQYLILTNNSLGGIIPSNISGCIRLIELRMYGNRLVGNIPPEIGFLQNLEYLSLSVTNITGTIPASLGNLSSLSILSLARTNLIGLIPNSLGKLKNLATLALGQNRLSGVVPSSIFNLTSLTQIDLGLNDLEGTLPSDLGNMLPYLQYLSIANNRFTGFVPASISNLSNLNVLQLSYNKLQGQVPSFENLNRLISLHLADNLFSTGHSSDLNFVFTLANATMLDVFDISENNFTGVVPTTMCNFSMLTSLAFQRNNLAGELPSCLGNLANLQYLEAWNNQLSGVIPESFGKLKSLGFLGLFQNQLSGYIPSSFGNLTELLVLNLQNNNLKGQIPSTLGNCRSLIALDLSANNLNGSIPSEILHLSSLSVELSLNDNYLSGSIPIEVGLLINLKGLYLYRNMLSGELPSTLGACVVLEFLDLRRNNFNGHIPDALRTLKGLHLLDLSNNSFSGKIPAFLMSLKLLDLSYNSLEGEVPTAGIFSNTSEFSVLGNSRLCGGIPELELPQCNISHTPLNDRSSNKKFLVIAILSALSCVIVVLVALLFVLYVICYRKRIKKSKADSNDDLEKLPHLSYQTLHKATNAFATENLIGSGTFGVVYKGILEEQRKDYVAIKVFNLKHHGISTSFLAECDVLRNVRHRNLVKVITACSGVDYQGNDFKALVYEYMVNGNLEDWLHPANPTSSKVEGTNYTSRILTPHQRLDIAIDIAFGLDYLHHHFGVPIVHCDIKPSNILLDDDLVAYVSDFGLAKFLSEGSTSRANESSSMGIRGTIGYTPPEYGWGNEVSTYGDVYSFGILLLEMFTGKRPTDDMFKGDVNLHTFVKRALPQSLIEILDPVILTNIYHEDQENNSSKMRLGALISIIEVALSCSTELPQDRLSMSEVVEKLSSIRDKLRSFQLFLDK